MTNTAIPIRTAALVLAAILSVIAIATVAVAFATDQRGGAMVVLVGLSHSVQGNRRAIDDCARRAVDRAIEDGADLTIMPVGRIPADLRSAPIHSRLSLADRLTPGEAKKRQKEVHEDAARRLAQVRARPRPTGASDTLAAASIGADALRESVSGTRRTLVVCDDAHQVSDLIDVYRERVTDDRARRVLRGMPATDLSGADVVFGAADTDAKGRLSHERETEIERFWRVHWARAVKARTVAYGVVPRFPRR